MTLTVSSVRASTFIYLSLRLYKENFWVKPKKVSYKDGIIRLEFLHQKEKNKDCLIDEKLPTACIEIIKEKSVEQFNCKLSSKYGFDIWNKKFSLNSRTLNIKQMFCQKSYFCSVCTFDRILFSSCHTRTVMEPSTDFRSWVAYSLAT